MVSQHTPVLLSEVLDALQPEPDSRLLDLTIGHAGHAAAWLRQAGEGVEIVGFDADSRALVKAREVLAPWQDQVTLVHSNFWQIKENLPSGYRTTADRQDSLLGGGILKDFSHVLFDLGIGSHQLDDASRGFSFTATGPLSMRYGFGEDLPPAEVDSLNTLEQKFGRLPDVLDLLEQLRASELAEVIRVYGEERYAGRIAKALQQAPLPTTGKELAERIVETVPVGYRHGRIHPATRTFQALRLAVNRELEALQVALPQAVEVLVPAGKIAVISFHSLEDRIVKQFFKQESATCICPPEQPQCTCDHEPQLKVITKKPIRPTEEEIEENPRSRSAKLRVAHKVSQI